jgi:hypothetical protein
MEDKGKEEETEEINTVLSTMERDREEIDEMERIEKKDLIDYRVCYSCSNEVIYDDTNQCPECGKRGSLCDKDEYYKMISSLLGELRFDFSIYLAPENEEERTEEQTKEYERDITFLSERLRGEKFAMRTDCEKELETCDRLVNYYRSVGNTEKQKEYIQRICNIILTGRAT